MGTQSTGQEFDEGAVGDDTKKLIVRFAAILVVSPLVGWMMARAWVPGHAIYDAAVDFLPDLIDGVTPTQAMQLVSTGGLGLYFGFLTIFILDIKKRVQGALLLLGTTLGLAVLTLQGVLLPNLDPGYTPNLMAFAALYAAALALDLDKLLSIDFSQSSLRNPRTASGELPEFSNAARGLFVVLAVVIAATLVQVVLADVYKVTDFLAAPVTVYLLYSFIQYEVKSDYMLLGPGQSGKSMAMLGMALTMYDFEDIQPKPNAYLQRAIERAGDPQYADDWPFEQTEGLQETSFQILVGDLFPRRMRVVAFDYPGQLLPEITERVRDLASSSRLSITSDDTPASGVQADGGAVTDAGSIVDIVSQDVVAADTLMVVIDCERLIGAQTDAAATPDGDSRSLGIEYYKPILENIDAENVIITATKADVLVHDNSLPVEPPETAGGFAEFERQVNDVLSQRYDIQELKQQLEQPEIHPVFYKTEKVDGEFVPLRDSSNNLIPVGYQQLVDAIRRAH
jgi:hypothetical protein